MTQVRQIVYIMARGHSGSTALDIVLGNAPDHESVGELISGIALYPDHEVATGVPMPECPYWTEVRERFEQKTGEPFEAAAREMAEASHIRNFQEFLTAPKDDPRCLRLRDLNRAMFAAIAETSGKSIIVDSTKEFTRGLLMARFMPEARIIHLVRDPVGIVASHAWRYEKGEGFKFMRRKYSRPELKVPVLLLAGVAWNVGNTLGQIVAALAPGRVYRVRYEDWCEDPATVLEGIAEWLGEDFGDLPERVAAGEALEIGHNIGGNRIRMKKEFRFNPKAGTDRPTGPVFSTVRALTLPLRAAYGYLRA